MTLKIKNAVGERWTKESDGKCLFLMAVESESPGRNDCRQIDDLLG